MIIFGTRGVTYSKGSGDFHCPTCGDREPYKHKRVRRFFTLYFIPVIPLDLHGEYVECAQCQGTYRLEVLEFDPAAGAAAFEAEYHRAIKRVMVEMMLADGEVDAEEVEVIRRIYGKLAGAELSEDDIRAEIVETVTRTHNQFDLLRALMGRLNDQGKEMVIKAAFLVAASDGVFQDEEWEMINAIGEVLEMTKAHLYRVVAELQQQT